jgi:hypothetical protein
MLIRENEAKSLKIETFFIKSNFSGVMNEAFEIIIVAT